MEICRTGGTYVTIFRAKNIYVFYNTQGDAPGLSNFAFSGPKAEVHDILPDSLEVLCGATVLICPVFGSLSAEKISGPDEQSNY